MMSILKTKHVALKQRFLRISQKTKPFNCGGANAIIIFNESIKP
jgi:hypothetical protein